MSDSLGPAERVLGSFAGTFGGAPDVIASAPGRVNLIGEHVDYNGGEVLPMGIEQRTWLAVRRTQGTASRAVSAGQEAVGEWDARSPRRHGAWWDYLSGVQAALVRRGGEPTALQIAVWSDVPAGAGLSSSAALEVAAVTAFGGVMGPPLDGAEVARLAHEVEHDYVGVACGIMDQYASALARENTALHIWCDSGDSEHVPLTQTVLIFDTALPRQLRASQFNTRRAECAEALSLLRRRAPALPNLASATSELLEEVRLPPPLDRRARHVVEETRRVRRAVEALREGGTLPGPLLYHSHESARSLYDCSTEQLDWFVERAALLPGISGARLTGAGWGGCAIAVGDREALAESAARLVPEYERRFGLTPRLWLSRASDGVRSENVRTPY